jgi:hypothetical protein
VALKRAVFVRVKGLAHDHHLPHPLSGGG